MQVRIEGEAFSGFPGMDAQLLQNLTYNGRVEWLHYRFDFVFWKPFRALLSQDGDNCYVWLCAINLLCSAIEALAPFEFFSTKAHERFSQFIESYFSAPFRNSQLNLYDPKPRKWVAVTPAQHMYKFFRCGLAHSFCIEWGGILHREDGAPDYLSEAHTSGGREFSLRVVPRELIADFERAVAEFFKNLGAKAGDNQHVTGFNCRFEDVYLMKHRQLIP